MRAKDARQIRAAILRARRFGWLNPPEMRMDARLGLTPIDPLQWQAWHRTMKRMGKEFPKPPTAPSGLRADAGERQLIASRLRALAGEHGETRAYMLSYDADFLHEIANRIEGVNS